MLSVEQRRFTGDVHDFRTLTSLQGDVDNGRLTDLKFDVLAPNAFESRRLGTELTHSGVQQEEAELFAFVRGSGEADPGFIFGDAKLCSGYNGPGRVIDGSAYAGTCPLCIEDDAKEAGKQDNQGQTTANVPV